LGTHNHRSIRMLGFTPLKYTSYLAILTIFFPSENLHAFTINPSPPVLLGDGRSTTSNKNGRQTQTRLYIIGPMIRKMRQEEAKKNQPMATNEELAAEAPGLKIGSGVWKWPPVWPYAPDFFQSLKDETNQEERSRNTVLMSTLGGAGGVAGGLDVLTGEVNSTASNEIDAEALNVMKYWSEEKADVLTELSEEASAQLTSHYAFYLRDGMSILELGAAEKSYLPEDLKFPRHVGVGLNKALMETNPSLTETIVTDFNDVEPEIGVKSPELSKLGSDVFDVILMANTVEFLTNPREVFKSAWRTLKPGGIMIVSFAERKAMTTKFADAQIKLWRGYNDDQHIWVTGSLFHFSAGEGWEKLKGFDISPKSAKKMNDDGVLSRFTNPQSNNVNNMFICQASKASIVETIDREDPEKSFSSLMWMTPTMESRDKALVAPRLARAFLYFEDQPERQLSIQKNVVALSDLYEDLIKMDQFAFPFALQANLAADLVTDPDFNANEEQMNALQMGLGLKTPSEEFWKPVGELTLSMDAEEKVNLLAYIVPRFGSQNTDQEESLQTFITGLKPTIAVVKSKCTNMSEKDATLVATELAASELLIPGRSSKEEFAAWMGALTDTELMDYATQRKLIKENAKNELTAMREAREEKKIRLQEKQEKWKVQVETARNERTMVFNEKTGKMEAQE